MSNDLYVAFPIIEGNQEYMIEITQTPYQGRDYRQDFLRGNTHRGLLGSGSELDLWAMYLRTYHAAEKPFELNYKPAKAFSGQSFGLAASIAWLRATNGLPKQTPPIIACGELKAEGLI